MARSAETATLVVANAIGPSIVRSRLFIKYVALFVTVVGLNFVGDALRDALDPRLKV